MIGSKRFMAINRIVKTLKTLKEKKFDYDKKKFLLEIMREFNICEKTAAEYFNAGAAIFEDKKNEDGILAETDASLT